jgi:hypothetical protein
MLGRYKRVWDGNERVRGGYRVLAFRCNLEVGKLIVVLVGLLSWLGMDELLPECCVKGFWMDLM